MNGKDFITASRLASRSGRCSGCSSSSSGDHAVGSDQGVVSDSFDEAEQRRPIYHLDLHQLLPGNLEDLCCLLDIIFIDQMLVGGEELGRIWVSPSRKESRLDWIEGFEVWNLN